MNYSRLINSRPPYLPSFLQSRTLTSLLSLLDRSHVNKRLAALPTLSLSLPDLLTVYGLHPTSPLVRNVALVYLEKAIARADRSDLPEALPGLLKGVALDAPTQRSIRLRMALLAAAPFAQGNPGLYRDAALQHAFGLSVETPEEERKQDTTTSTPLGGDVVMETGGEGKKDLNVEDVDDDDVDDDATTTHNTKTTTAAVTTASSSTASLPPTTSMTPDLTLLVEWTRKALLMRVPPANNVPGAASPGQEAMASLREANQQRWLDQGRGHAGAHPAELTPSVPGLLGGFAAAQAQALAQAQAQAHALLWPPLGLTQHDVTVLAPPTEGPKDDPAAQRAATTAFATAIHPRAGVLVLTSRLDLPPAACLALYVVAAGSPLDVIASLGDDLLRRRCGIGAPNPVVNLEDPHVVEDLLRLVVGLGDGGGDGARSRSWGSPPAVCARALGLLAQSEAAAGQTEAALTILEMAGVLKEEPRDSNPAPATTTRTTRTTTTPTRLAQGAVAFGLWSLQRAPLSGWSTATLSHLVERIVTDLESTMMMISTPTGPQLSTTTTNTSTSSYLSGEGSRRAFLYEALRVIAGRWPQLVADDTRDGSVASRLPALLFRALSSVPADLRGVVQETITAVGRTAQGSGAQIGLVPLLEEAIRGPHVEVRRSAVAWVAHRFPFAHARARALCIVALADPVASVVEVARRGLDPVLATRGGMGGEPVVSKGHRGSERRRMDGSPSEAKTQGTTTSPPRIYPRADELIDDVGRYFPRWRSVAAEGEGVGEDAIPAAALVATLRMAEVGCQRSHIGTVMSGEGVVPSDVEDVAMDKNGDTDDGSVASRGRRALVDLARACVGPRSPLSVLVEALRVLTDLTLRLPLPALSGAGEEDAARSMATSRAVADAWVAQVPRLLRLAAEVGDGTLRRRAARAAAVALAACSLSPQEGLREEKGGGGGTDPVAVARAWLQDRLQLPTSHVNTKTKNRTEINADDVVLDQEGDEDAQRKNAEPLPPITTDLTPSTTTNTTTLSIRGQEEQALAMSVVGYWVVASRWFGTSNPFTEATRSFLVSHAAQHAPLLDKLGLSVLGLVAAAGLSAPDTNTDTNTDTVLIQAVADAVTAAGKAARTRRLANAARIQREKEARDHDAMARRREREQRGEMPAAGLTGAEGGRPGGSGEDVGASSEEASAFRCALLVFYGAFTGTSAHPMDTNTTASYRPLWSALLDAAPHLDAAAREMSGEALAVAYGGTTLTLRDILAHDELRLAHLPAVLDRWRTIHRRDPRGLAETHAGDETAVTVTAATPTPPSPFHAMVVEAVLETLPRASEASVRATGVTWLWSVLRYATPGFVPHGGAPWDGLAVQQSLTASLSDRDPSMVQLATDGISMTYSLGNSEERARLVASLSDLLQGGGTGPAGTRGMRPKDEAGAPANKIDPKVTPSTQVFDEHEAGGITTYKELCDMATELGRPELVYRFMDLAHHQKGSATSAGAALGLAEILRDAHGGGGRRDAKTPHSHLNPDPDPLTASMAAILPKMYRQQFDPAASVREAMRSVWSAFVPDTDAALRDHWSAICAECLRALGARAWRERESGAWCLADLIRGQPWSVLGPYWRESLTMGMRASDDVKETVRAAGVSLLQSLGNTAERLVTAASSGEASAISQAHEVVTVLLDAITSPGTGLGAEAEEVRVMAALLLTKTLTACPGPAVQAELGRIVPALLETLSNMEDPRLGAMETQASLMTSHTAARLASARVQAAQRSPMQQALDVLARRVEPGPGLDALIPPLVQVLKRGLGLNTRVGAARFTQQLAMKVGAYTIPYPNMTNPHPHRNLHSSPPHPHTHLPKPKSTSTTTSTPTPTHTQLPSPTLTPTLTP